jgi:asparagine synthase (glutamine-hydrolysing)
MSMQAGIWHYDHKPILPETFDAFEERLAAQGPDGRGRFEDPGFAMLHCAFYITEEDSLETQPIRATGGSVLTWDGRLDNRQEILTALGRSEADLPTDAEIAIAALDAWDSRALPRLIGDWALSYWNPQQRRLLLARDCIGMRTLYYLPTKNSFFWSTDLAALVLHSGERFNLSDEYFAGFFTSNPEPHLTPYDEIKAVPPGGYLEVTSNRVRVRRYWSFNSVRAICYRSDSEYEEHFRQVFRQSVRRRLRTSYPILSDLSGGLDSSSIVCMVHDIVTNGEASANLNTFSIYSLEEPGGDERPYFEAVERHIGKRGTHMEVRSDGSTALSPLRDPYFSPFPEYSDGLLEGEREFLSRTGHQGNRLHFKGLGGDELLGGVQNPVPELAALLWKFRLVTFKRQVIAWALQRKTTVWSLLGQAVLSLAPISIRELLHSREDMPTWFRSEFARRQHIVRRRISAVTDWRAHLPGPPSPDSQYLSLAASLVGYLPPFSFSEQWALPYYDRDLVSFLFAIPDEQILRPQQRRSIMRRGLKGIVPDEVLLRKTKWLGRRQPALDLLGQAKSLVAALPGTAIADRCVDPATVEEDFKKLKQGQDIPLLLLERLLQSCFFFRHLADRELWQSAAQVIKQKDLGSTAQSSSAGIAKTLTTTSG